MRKDTLKRLIPLAIAATASFLLTGSVFRAHRPRSNDFEAFYRGASAAASGHLADLYREQLAVPPPDLPFVRPPAYALLIEPIARIPFIPAFYLWTSIQLAVFLALLFLAQAKVPISAFACLYPPVVLGIALGQDCLFPLLILVGAYLMLRAGKDFPAGIVLGLGSFKFHLFLLWPVALLLQKRWRALAGVTATGATLLGLSVVFVGPAGIRNYLLILPSRALIPGAIGIGPFMDYVGMFSSVLQASFGIVATAIALYVARTSNGTSLFVLIPTATLAVMPHAMYYDTSILLLPFWLVASCSGKRILKIAALIIVSPGTFWLMAAHKPWTEISNLAILGFFLMTLAAMLWDIAHRSRDDVDLKSSGSDRPVTIRYPDSETV